MFVLMDLLVRHALLVIKRLEPLVLRAMPIPIQLLVPQAVLLALQALGQLPDQALVPIVLMVVLLVLMQTLVLLVKLITINLLPHVSVVDQGIMLLLALLLKALAKVTIILILPALILPQRLSFQL